MLDTELGTHGDLRMVSGEDIARAKRELPLTEEDSLAKGTLDRLRTNPGADFVVLGSYTLMQGDVNKRLRLDLRLQDTASGETIAEEAITGEQNNLFDLATEAGARLRQRLGPGSILDRGQRCGTRCPALQPARGPALCRRAGETLGI
jgi:hypothetical protein